VVTVFTAAFKVHTAAVQTYQGAGSMGPQYAAAVDVRGFLDDGLVLQRTAAGEQLVQQTTFYADLADAPKFTPESLVTVNGRDCVVDAARPRDGGPLFRAVEHVEVTLR
jgi:hypothetical protein